MKELLRSGISLGQPDAIFIEVGVLGNQFKK